MTWWRSRYVQHLEAENAELRETVKRMLNPQWRYLLYGEQSATEARPVGDKAAPDERIKIRSRKTWQEIAPVLTRMVSPEYQIEQKRKEREEHIHSVTERIG